MLALEPGRVVTVPALMEELWGTKLPRSATPTLQTYILQLRRLLAAAVEPGAPRDVKEILGTRYGGYVLDISATSVDVHCFQQLAERGRCALGAGAAESASRLLGAALDHWRGAALVDVRLGCRLETEVVRLQAWRLETLRNRIDADLRLGRHHQLLPELGVLVAQLPMHEDVCSQYMLALYRSGRSWQALEAYNRLRRILVAELGTEPSAPVQRLQMGILNADPDLDCAQRPLVPLTG